MRGYLNRVIKKRPLIIGFFLSAFFLGCNRTVEVPEPISSVTSDQVFSSDATATSAMLGIYYNMLVNRAFSNLETTFYAGESADELTDQTSGTEYQDIFLSNTLTSLGASSTSLQNFWQPAYFYIYSANAVISGIESSTGMTSATKSQLRGEAEFIRAFCYFYLTNLFGEVPIVLSTDFNQTVLLAKSSQAKIYQQIVSDLLDGQNSMLSDFSLSGGQPIRANKWAATALLARVYLYQQNWASADSAASAVIKSGQFSLVPLPQIQADYTFPDSDAFEANTPEAILQLQSQSNVYPYATWEGNFFIPYYSFFVPSAWLTTQLLSAFEPDDLRRINWVDSNVNNGVTYYYPYKYKVNVGPGSIAENYTMLRFSEQYLIRAEAEANLSQLGPAINDLNTIRSRAGLDSLPASLSQSQVLSAIQQENRIEFFAEWGHRWFDLKRWGIAIQTMDTISYKRSIDSTQLLYPIPLIEIQNDPNLTQNPGYLSH
jgi:hypothetical protein